MVTREAYYLISPTEPLSNLLKSRGDEWTCLLEEPVLWSRQEPWEMPMPVQEWCALRVIQVKMVFMLDLVSEYSPSVPKSDNSTSWTFNEFLWDLLQLPTLSVGTFDKWWTLQRFDFAATTYEVAFSKLRSNAVTLAKSLTIPLP